MKGIRKWLIVVSGIVIVGTALLLVNVIFVPAATAEPRLELIVLTSLPDLTVQLSVTPSLPQVGEAVTITIRVLNQGSTSARDFCSYLYVDPADEPPNQTTSYTYDNCLYASLGAGYSYSWSKKYTFTEGGEHHLYAWVDRDDAVDEENENNNRDSLSLTVGCQVDTYEEDDTCSSARLVAPDGVHYRHTLCPLGDEDWIRIDMTQGLEYVVTTSDVGADGDTKLTLYDLCDEDPLTSDDPTLGPDAQLVWFCTASGPHYIRVSHHDPTYGPDTHYDLSVRVRCTGDGYEPDDTCQTARESVVNGDLQDHLFCTPGDEDWVRFRAVAGLDYHISLENIGPAAQPRLALYRVCGDAPIAEAGVGEAIDWTCLRGGLYYVRVLDDSPSTYGPSAYYRLRLAATGQSGDSYEPDGSSALARPIQTDGTSQHHNTSPGNDQDWLYFDATAGQSYRIETLEPGPASDTVVCLYDTDAATLLTCDDDSGPGPASRIWWTCLTTGRYYLKVRDYRQDVGGGRADYNVSVTAGATACDEDTWENDDTYYQSPAIAADGTWQRHNICPEGDVDWVRFWTPAHRTYAFETANLGPDADTLLTLYDTDGQTLLWTNDDVGPGRASRILWTFDREGIYYIETEPFARTGSGTGTEYDLRVITSTVTPTPTPTATPIPTPSPTPTPTPLPSAHTLIVTNRERLKSLYGQTDADALMSALTSLAGHEDVLGVVIDVSQDETAAAAYVTWVADPTSVTRANQVTDAVRNLIVRQMDRSPDLEYIVLVGDDRVIPFRRVADRPDLTGAYESLYSSVSPISTVGAALQANMSLNDDFYADRVPQVWDGQPLYLPDVAIARLVESPSDIVGLIAAFLTDQTLTVNKAMVAGYSVLQDGAQQICDWWGSAGVPGLDCALVGEGWGAPELQARQLQAVPRFDLQALATGANHYIEGSPAGSRTYAQDVVNASANLSGTLIWNTGRYAGLNVPPGNPESGLDLPEAFARKGANYVGNTGTTLVGRRAPLLAERLMSLFARELTLESNVTIGKAWMRAKRRYFQETLEFSEYDRKVLSVATMYGLPMAVVRSSGGALSDPFPSVGITLTIPGSLGEVVSVTLELGLEGAFGSLGENNSPDGDYFSLDGHVAFSPDVVAQPHYYHSTAGWGYGPARGVVWTGGVYSDTANFVPLRAEAVVLDGLEPGASRAQTSTSEPRRGWSPALPVAIRGENGELFSLFLGQYDEELGRERLYANMAFDLYLGDAPDQTPPEVSWAAGRAVALTAQIKVEADDPSGVQRVVAVYTYNDGWWNSLDLRYEPTTHKWVGAVPAWRSVTWFAQVVDGAGNVTTVDNKGSFYHLALAYDVYLFYLPMIIK